MFARMRDFFSRKTHLPPVKVEEVVSTLNEVKDWGLIQNNISNVWKKTKGEGVIIAVIDTGMPRHQDIGDNAILGMNCIPGQDTYDNHGHQTHCVGIICAKQNDTGMVGVAPMSKSLCIKGLSDSGSGSYAGLNKELQYCIEMKPDLVSMSLGGTTPDIGIHDKIKQLYNMNIPVICAAGNSGQSGVNYPAKYLETIAVAAYDKFGNIANFSSKGSEVDFASPGVQIYSTYLKQKYSRMSGTSMACPFLAGVVALLISKWKQEYTKYSVRDIKNKLIEFADDKGIIGKDDSWGYGIVDVDDMINNSNSRPEPEPEPEPEPKPEPEPEPAPVPEKPNWFKSNLAWVVCGTFIIIAIIFYLTSLIQNTDNIYVPYIDEDGNIDWNEKYELESNEQSR